jgi:uncharacterized protein (TIGR03437 family)
MGSKTKRSLALLLVFSGFTCALRAQDTRDVTEPAFPPVCVQLAAQLSAGPVGLPAASETLFDTSRIQGALNQCSAGNAVELQASGANNAFLITPITLPQGVTLLVDAGVTLFASRNPRDYDADSTHSCGAANSSGSRCLSLITAAVADGAGIMGYGTIDQRGQLPMLVNGQPSLSWADLSIQADAAGLPAPATPRLLQVTGTTSFTLYKIALLNAPASIHATFDYSINLTIWGIKIMSPYDTHSAGIDIGYSGKVTIANSYISDGDDLIAVSGQSPGASNISIINNHFGDGHGVSMGSYTQDGIKNVLVDRVSFAGNSADTNQIAIRFKSDVSRGGLVQNITYSNVCTQNVRTAISLDPFYTANATGNLLPWFQNIAIQNVHATTEGLVVIEGHDASVPTVINLDNVQIDGIKSSDVTTEYTNFTLGPDPVNFATLLKGTGVTVANNVSTSNAPYSCPPAIFSPIAGELIPGPSQISAGQALGIMVQVFPTKEIPYQTYLTNLKTSPNATLAMPSPTGTVVINDGSTAVGSGTLTGSQLLTIPLDALSPGPHTLTATYSGDSNYANITFGSYSLMVAAAPAITAGGIVNTASYAPGVIAQGSLFSIFGNNLGPGTPVTADSFPIPATLGGASVTITQNGRQYDAWMEYASASQVNAILPSNVPAGSAQATVTYNGQTSLPVNFSVVSTNFGVFFTPANGAEVAIAQNFVAPFSYPLNQPSSPATPGQIVLVWGTGMGPIATPDNVAAGAAAVDLTNVPVVIAVGGVPAQRLYAGRQSQSAAVDNIYFTIPAGAPLGCQVPVAITANGVAVNATTIAITADGSPCQ